MRWSARLLLLAALVAHGGMLVGWRWQNPLTPYFFDATVMDGRRGLDFYSIYQAGYNARHGWDIYEGAIRVLMRRSRDAEAFAVAERGRARFLLNVMAERDASRPPSSRGVELGRRLRERSDEHATARDESERAALAAEIAALSDSLARLGQEEIARDPSAAARYPAPAPLGEIQDHVATSGRTLVSFFWGDSAVYGWSVSATGLRAARLGIADSLAAQVSFLTTALSDAGGRVEWRAAAERLYRTLMAPLGPLTDDLLIVPDGALARLPVEVLIPAGGQPLGATHLITYAPSASVSLALARATPPSPDRALLAVGNPALGQLAEDSATGPTRGPSLEPLPFAEDEARAIYQLFRAQGSDLLVGRQASPERWHAREPSRYRYLHFAAHAIVDDRRPDRTRVALAGGDLTLPDIRQLTLAAELVTLSACETALGRQVRGEGVIGLPHAFLAAGARSVVVTLWRVRDRAAADFMREFYAEVAGKAAPAEALRTVRRRWISADGPRSAPEAWAAFVLVGG